MHRYTINIKKLKFAKLSFSSVVRSLTVLSAFSVAQLAYGAEFKIADIRIEGLQRVSASPVFAALPIQAGDYADANDIRAAIRELFATGFFDDLEVLRDGEILIVKVKERPTISEITIDGNKAIKTEMLEDAMSKNDLAEGQIFQRSMLEGIVNELERQYVAQGRYAAEVEATIVDLPNNQIKIEVLVDEGSVAAIKHLNIVGNKVFSDSELISLFELKTTGWLSWMTSNDRYAREKLKGDIESLESYYLDRGYLDFKVVSSQVSLSPDQKSVYITLNVDEGDVYTVNKIELAGDLIVPEKSIRRLVLLREGQTFSQNLMTTTEEYMTTLLGNAGYTNAEVEGIPNKNVEDKTVEITFLVNPSHRMYVRRIEFKGNTRTQDEVLRREMRQMEQSSASNAKIEQGKIRLERLGFFKGVETENKDVPGTNDLVDVEYTVEEQPSGAVNASVGYGQGSGFLLGASLQENNWLGTGKQVGFSVNHSQYQTLYNLSYSDPYFTPDGVSRGWSLFYNARDYSKINVSSYTTDSYGLNLSFGYPISEIQRLNYSFGYTHLSVETGAYTVQEIRRTPFKLDLENRNYFAVLQSVLSEVPEQVSDGLFEDFSLDSVPVTEAMEVSSQPGFVDVYGDEFDTFSFKMGWIRSTLNRGILATRGSKQTLSLDVSIPGSDLEYFTLEYDGQVFLPLTQDLTMRFRTSLGYGDGYGDMEQLPFFRNFYAGGFGSIRGFRRSSLGPQASPPASYTGSLDRIPINYIGRDSDGDGTNDVYETLGAAYVLCEEDLMDSLGRPLCVDGQLQRSYSGVSRRSRSFGGNVLMEFGAELLFPIPFLEDQRSVQLSLFVDAGNVFDTECGATQANCFKPDLSELRASYGISLNWLSAMGPLSFSYAEPFQFNDDDQPEQFQFNMGVPF